MRVWELATVPLHTIKLCFVQETYKVLGTIAMQISSGIWIILLLAVGIHHTGYAECVCNAVCTEDGWYECSQLTACPFLLCIHDVHIESSLISGQYIPGWKLWLFLKIITSCKVGGYGWDGLADTVLGKGGDDAVRTRHGSNIFCLKIY